MQLISNIMSRVMVGLLQLKPRLRPLPPVDFDDKYGASHIAIATWFGAGRIRPASGTWGTIGGILPGYFIYKIGGMPALALAALLLLWIGTKAADYYGRKSGEPDDQAIVVDEVVGLWIAALPAADVPGLWFIAFVLFRVFDIFKPWPASFFEKRKGGRFDVMMDDVVAGIYAMIGVAATAVPYLMRK